MTPGEHTVRIVLDPDERFDELVEFDNVFERTFTWHDAPDPDPELVFEMSDEEIADAFAPVLNEWRYEVRPVLGAGAGERDWTPEIMRAGRATYYLLTGRDLDAEGYVLHFLPADQFNASAVATCMSNWVTMSTSEYEDTFTYCTERRGEIGFKTRSNGQIHIFVDLGLSPMDALGTYLHELGHGLADLRNPGQVSRDWTTGVRGLFEAQAQIFEAAGWRAIEEFTGQNMSAFPDVAPARDRFEFLFELRRDRGTEHDIGYRLLWTEALSDVGALGVPDQLRSNGRLNSAEAMLVYSNLVDLFPSQIDSLVAQRLARTDLIDEFEQIAAARFVDGLPLESTAHSALQDATWAAP